MPGSSAKRNSRARLSRLRRQADRRTTPVEATQSALGQRRWWLIITAVGIPLFGLGVPLLWVGWSAVQADRAVEDADDRDLAEKPALLAEAKRIGLNEGWDWVFSKRYTAKDMGHIRRYGPNESSSTRSSFARADAMLRRMGGQQLGGGCPLKPNESSVDSPCRATKYRVTLVGHRSTKVRITSLRAHVLDKTRAPSGTLLRSPPQGGGPADAVHIDLDSPHKNAMLVKEGILQSKQFVNAENRWVEDAEPLVFKVTASTDKHLMYDWELLVGVAYDDKRETIRVRLPDNKPFRTIGWSLDGPYESVLRYNIPTDRVTGTSAGGS